MNSSMPVYVDCNLAKLTNSIFSKGIIKAKLTRDDLFSNKMSQHIHYIEDDDIELSWTS